MSGGGEEEEAEEEAEEEDLKTRVPHNDVGKKLVNQFW